MSIFLSDEAVSICERKVVKVYFGEVITYNYNIPL